MPEGIDLRGAAPLLCAGITTWSPLRHWQVGQGSKVAVVGLGGLGHMAIKIAKALGADVTLFTRSPGKEADARRPRASDVVLSADSEQMKDAGIRVLILVSGQKVVPRRYPYTTSDWGTQSQHRFPELL